MDPFPFYCWTDEAVLNAFADAYGQTVYCEKTPEWEKLREELLKDCENLKAEILRRMKNTD